MRLFFHLFHTFNSINEKMTFHISHVFLESSSVKINPSVKVRPPYLFLILNLLFLLSLGSSFHFDQI